MYSINVLIKPASGLCQMKCNYCFYTDEIKHNNIKMKLMDLSMLEVIVKKVLETADHECGFAFQGGEPTLAGLDFFKKHIEYQKRYNKKGIKITNVIQTNGLEINHEWAEFFYENQFLVGLSLDGYQLLHDKNRISKSGEGTFERVMETAAILKNYKVDFNILTVITELSAANADKIYRFFRRMDFRHQQYIPCIDAFEFNQEYDKRYLSPEGYYSFLKELFDLWYEDLLQNNIIFIRYFINLLEMMRGYPPDDCALYPMCGRQYVVEADGSVFPCDFYVNDAYRLGNAVDDTFAQIDKTRKEIRFCENSGCVPEECLKCSVYQLCTAGCMHYRSQEPTVPSQKNIYCDSYKKFLPYAMKQLGLFLRGRRE